MHESEAEEQRGRHAERPSTLKRGWRDVFRRVRTEAKKDHLDVVAGGVAFYAFLSLFPALAAGVSLYGLIADPADAVKQLDSLLVAAPADVREIVSTEASRLAGQSNSALSLGVLGTLLLAVWSANKGTKGMIGALNITYDEARERGFLRQNALSLALTLGAILSVSVMLGLLVVLPWMFDLLGLGAVARTAAQILRWPVLALWILGSLAVLYRFAPARQSPKWRWVTPGSVLATLLLLTASAVFSLYASRFGSLNRTYGVLGAVAILLIWLFLAAYSILLGGELNAEAEHQTKADSTTGPPRPLGARGAYSADTVGR